MKLLGTIGISVGGAVVVAAAGHYAFADPRFLGGTVLAGPWSVIGGAGGAAALVYGVLAFALVTVGAYSGLRRARVQLARPTVDPKLLPAAWRNALAGTDLEALGAFLPGEDLAISPLALLRVLRHEIWRGYGVRLLATQLVTALLGVLALAAAPYLGPLARVSASDPRLGWAAVVLALVIAVGAWLLIDSAIRRLAVTVSRIAASWEVTVRDQPVASKPPARPAFATPTGSDTLAAAMDRLTAGLAARVANEPTTGPALVPIEAALRELASRQEALIGALARGLEQRVPSGTSEPFGMGEALVQLAAAVDKLADPLLRRMRLLDASDRRLLTVLRRQEEAVGSVGTKWGELVSALQAMSAGLDSFARAAASRLDQDQQLLASEPVEPGALSDELQELLDEMSDVDEPPPHRAAT